MPRKKSRKLELKCKKKYCGDNDALPDGYERFGTRSECLRTGFGVAYKKQIDNKKKFPTSYRNLERFIEKHFIEALEVADSKKVGDILISLFNIYERKHH